MKLNINPPKSQTNQSSNNLKKAKISDIKVIVDLLRRHYAFPIRTLVQEYLSNARDAHRESRQTRAIEVSLPTKSNPLFKIRDFGSGMDETRLEENFLSYGNSTKNMDNLQTGGFGIGSKSAWVYTPTFYIKVVNNKIATTFEASIAVHYEGALREISKKETTEESGVEISIPVQIKDIKEFNFAFYRATYFWEEPVSIVNLTEDEVNQVWLEKNYISTDKMFFLGTEYDNNFWDAVGVEDFESVVVLDGILYNISGDLDCYLGKDAILKFKTGELSVSISRESIEDVPDNRKKIKKQSHESEVDKQIKQAFVQLEKNFLLKKECDFSIALKHAKEKSAKFEQLLSNIASIAFNPLNNTIEELNKSKESVILKVSRYLSISLDLSGVKCHQFYKTRNNSFAIDRSGGTYRRKNAKFIINDTQETVGNIERTIKYQTNSAAFKDYDYVFVINNYTEDKAKKIIDFIKPIKWSAIYPAVKSSNIAKKNNQQKFKKRSALNCHKKVFQSKDVKTLKTCIHSSGVFNKKEYLILSWDDQEMIDKIHEINKISKEAIPVYFVNPKDLSLFKGQKFFNNNNFTQMMFFKNIKNDLAKLSGLNIKKIPKTEVGNLLDTLVDLSILKNIDKSMFYFSNPIIVENAQKLCKILNIKQDNQFNKKIEKMFKNKHTKYILHYVSDGWGFTQKEIYNIKKDLGL